MAEITDYLQDLGEQQEVREKEIMIVHNPVVDKLCKLYEIRVGIRKGQIIEFGSHFENCLWLLRNMNYTAKDIFDVCARLKEYETYTKFMDMGAFISALIEHCKEKKIIILTHHFAEKHHCICCDLKDEEKTIEIFGNVGENACVRMEGGTVIINGDSYDCLGALMKGGKIIVKGNVNQRLAGYSHGGEIHIEGKFNGEIDRGCQVKIYHKNKLIHNGTG